MPAHIRSASPEDAEALVSVTQSAVRGLSGDYYTQEEREAWIDGVSKEAMREGLRDTEKRTYVAEIRTQTVGFSTLQGNYVRAVYVRPKA